MLKSDFFYDLPESLIAQTPPAERGGARLLCMDAEGDVTDRVFSHLPQLLRPGDLLVLNDTRVIPARLFGRKATGGRVEILIERVLDAGTALAHIRASKSPRADTRIDLDGGYHCQVIGRQDDLFAIRFPEGMVIEDVLAAVGHIPLPPYIERADTVMDRERYQTVFARQSGAVAAPTAGLHFNEGMLGQLAGQGVEHAFVTLHVGSGTFLPVRVDDLDQHQMHAELCSVPLETVERIRETRSRGGRVVAVGTTVVRCLETASRSGELLPFHGETRIFIKPGFAFHTVDALLTNFHLPESTLLTLVCAFAGYAEVMAAYRLAVERDYRFFSYGDAMFLVRRSGEQAA